MRRVGLWMYQNGGGDLIERSIVAKLKERNIEVVVGLDLRFATATTDGIVCNGINMSYLDAFFSYNAGEQTLAQVYMYEALASQIPTINNYEAFKLSEDKFRTNMAMASKGIRTTDFLLCHREQIEPISNKFDEWSKIVLKPIDGWGGTGMVLLDSRSTFESLKPFFNQMDIRQIYVERFIENDFSDYRIDIVDGEFVGCYGRRASERDWRTNITSGGSIITREPNDELVDLATRATEAVGLEIAGVDILYDREREEYVVLEVNGIPAFATPEQEKLGIDFNTLKIDKIVNMIDKITKKGRA